ncbi:hypothetical protein B6N60_01220 [Richelia sinica FACHB-800]|uniref:Uncharacterized protein n=1 Tax=Richelia sinica FACHB-800 TaxID=1357546 RepID=A0A975T5J7_9NOST|nr:hypothetical protein [Richelia sinica]MBD2664239.1 hypothetical protein [Richelia sinica FACHB-800]QXE22537.1 hypothetical protein B6N60_01220 [Richelia sinica FACHB-800]
MTKQINNSDTFYTVPSLVELDLLETLLTSDTQAYPWNPSAPESEAYFHQLEEEFACEDLFDAELTTGSANFYHQLDHLWCQFSAPEMDRETQTVENKLLAALHHHFTNLMPANLLNTIAQKATELVSLTDATSDKLVQCVQSLLPNWENDDLLVLARPYAYAMRSSEKQNLTSIINNCGEREWHELSEIEQAKISLAIAHYAFQQLQESDTEA